MKNKGPIAYMFNPNVTFPAYLVRNRLLKGVTKYAGQLQGTLLDFGCGSKPYKSLINVENYIGLDFDGQGHDHTNEQIDVFYDGKKIPFENEYFDSVFTSEVFEHVFNLEEVLQEIHRVMKKGGLILITCPFAICEHEVPNDFARYSIYAMRYLMEKNGFEIVAQEKLGNTVEVVVQLWISYIHSHIAPMLRKIPIVRSSFRLFTYTSLNIFAIIFGKVFPAGNELYLNNLILCRKK